MSILLSAIYAECHTECHYTECHYAECCGSIRALLFIDCPNCMICMLSIRVLVPLEMCLLTSYIFTLIGAQAIGLALSPVACIIKILQS
jgi:hypothetical protein